VCQQLLTQLDQLQLPGEKGTPERLKLKVGVAFFNDVSDGDQNAAEHLDKTVDTRLAKLQDFATHGGALIKALREHNADPEERKRRNGGGDPKEQVFRGLQFGVAAAGFSKGIGPKLVILIGDSGNNDKYDAGRADAPTPERLAAQLVPLPVAGAAPPG